MTADETVGAGILVLLRNQDPLLSGLINKALEEMPNGSESKSSETESSEN